MRPKDHKLHVSPSPSSPCPMFESPIPSDHEPVLSPWSSDPSDPVSANWESAWIDLGGEG